MLIHETTIVTFQAPVELREELRALAVEVEPEPTTKS